MSQNVRLSSKLPGEEEINGLDHLATAGNLHDPETPICCVVWVVPSKITEDLATGVRVPTVEIRRIEPIGRPSQVPQAIIDLAAELYEKRTGKNPLPFGALIVPKGEVDELDDQDDERMVRADAAAAEVLMGMSNEDRDIALGDEDDAQF